MHVPGAWQKCAQGGNAEQVCQLTCKTLRAMSTHTRKSII